MDRTRSILTLASLLAALLLLAACGGDDDFEAAPETATEEAAPEPTPPAEPPAEPEEAPPAATEAPEEAPAELPEAPPEEAEAPAEPPAEAAEPAEVGTTTNVSHGPVSDEVVLCVDIETNPPQEGQAFEVTVVIVHPDDPEVELPPISGEFGASGKATVRTNVFVGPGVTYAVQVRVGMESKQQEITVGTGSVDMACTI